MALQTGWKTYLNTSPKTPIYTAHGCARRGADSFILPDECVRGLIAFRRGIGLESDTEFNYQQSFFMGGVAEAARAWLECGCRESPRELTRILLGTFAYGNDDMFIW